MQSMEGMGMMRWLLGLCGTKLQLQRRRQRQRSADSQGKEAALMSYQRYAIFAIPSEALSAALRMLRGALPTHHPHISQPLPLPAMSFSADFAAVVSCGVNRHWVLTRSSRRVVT